MKLYLANGIYCGTQDEAKKITKLFDHVEVPTDKPGLIRYLNQTFAPSEPEDEFTTVVERHDPPVDLEAEIERRLAEKGQGSQTLAFDDAWDNFPLARKLHFASLACEEARTAIAPKAKPAPSADDELFS